MTISFISSTLLSGVAAANVAFRRPVFEPINNRESSITAQLSWLPRSSSGSETKQSANVISRFKTTLDKSNKKRQTELPTTFLDKARNAMTCDGPEPKSGFCPTQSSGLAPVPITPTVISMTCDGPEPKSGFCPTQSSGLAPVPITETILSMTCDGPEPKSGFCPTQSSGLAPVPITPTVISMPFALNENNLPQKTGVERNQKAVAFRGFPSLTTASVK